MSSLADELANEVAALVEAPLVRLEGLTDFSLINVSRLLFELGLFTCIPISRKFPVQAKLSFSLAC